MGSYLTEKGVEKLFLMADGKMAHAFAGLAGHNSNEEFQLYTEEKKGGTDTR